MSGQKDNNQGSKEAKPIIKANEISGTVAVEKPNSAIIAPKYDMVAAAPININSLEEAKPRVQSISNLETATTEKPNPEIIPPKYDLLACSENDKKSDTVIIGPSTEIIQEKDKK